MLESQSKKNRLKPPEVHAEGDSIAVRFEPKSQTISALAHGSETTISILGLLLLVGALLYKWSALGPWAIFLFIVSFGIFFAITAPRRWKQPRLRVTHQGLIFQGGNAESLLKGGLLQVAQDWIKNHRPVLPEPDAKTDSAGRTIAFEPGEKERILQEQRVIEAEVIKEVGEITGTIGESKKERVAGIEPA